MLNEQKIELAKKYAENEERNAHTENVLLLAENFGTTVQIKSVENILKMKRVRGYINPTEANLCSLISKQHFDKIRAEYLEVR
jgi:nucleoside diphosphate kinase